MKKVLVTGVLGQDGANMAEFLLRQGEPIMVYGMMRRSSNPNFVNAKNFKDHPNFKFVFGDLSDDVSIDNVVREVQPDYLVNFAANSFVGCSWDMPEQVFETNAKNLNQNADFTPLEAVRSLVMLTIPRKTSITPSSQGAHTELLRLQLGI